MIDGTFYFWSQKVYRDVLTNVAKVHTQMVAVTKCTITKIKNTGECRCLQLTNWFANRVNQSRKSKSPALNVGYNSLKRVPTNESAPQNVV